MRRGKPLAGRSTVRPATVEDLHELAALFRAEAETEAAFAPSVELLPGIDWTAYVRQVLEQPRTAVHVVERGGTLTGFMTVRMSARPARRTPSVRRLVRAILRRGRPAPVRLIEPQLAGVVEHIYIAPDDRSYGTLALLVRTSLDWLRGQGATLAEGRILAANERMLTVARFLGFEPAIVIVRKPL